MISRRLSVVSFDAFSTLLKPAGGVGAQYAAAAERLVGWQIQPDLLQSSFIKEFKEHRASFPNYGFQQGITTRQWWVDLVEKTFHNVFTTSPIDNVNAQKLNHIATHLYENFECDLYPHTLQLLQHLKETRGLRLCVISNSDERLEDFLRSNGIADCFDLILTSRHVGVEKPNPEIFRHALAHLGRVDGHDFPLLPEAVLHIGDDVDCDFNAARRLGMKALIVDHRRKITKDPFVCHDLLELVKKIDDVIEADED